MISKAVNELTKIWLTGQGTYIFLGLLFFSIFIAPILITDGLLPKILIEIAFLLILITGIWAAPYGSWIRAFALLLVFLTVVCRGLSHLNNESQSIAFVDHLTTILVCVIFALLMIKHFFKGNNLLRYRIAAAVAVYLLFGVIWARIYEIINLVNPHSFSVTVDSFSLIYFSFTTLVTLGYGDIVPVSLVARNLSILEAVTGQLYMVILISTLVSEFSALTLLHRK